MKQDRPSPETGEKTQNQIRNTRSKSSGATLVKQHTFLSTRLSTSAKSTIYGLFKMADGFSLK